MTTEPLPQAEDSAYLTHALRRAGVLHKGQVVEVTVESTRLTILSRITRLRLAYDEPATAPATLILKTANPERAKAAWQGGRHEADFYAGIAGLTPGHLVPRCYDADWNADTGAWRLLLEDVTDSHRIATAWPIPPTMEDCERIMVARARFHAAWWDDRRLGISIGTWAEAHDPQIATFAAQFDKFVDRVGERLSPQRRDLYRRLIDQGHRLNGRYHTHRDLTVIHGDAHAWNIFLPNPGSDQQPLLFDWDAWRIDVATDDLAYMMALHWYPEMRARAERPLLDRYHAALLACGVTGYDRRALEADYRLSALWQIATPVWQAENNIPPVIWWNHLERIFLAVEDLGCADLLAV